MEYTKLHQWLERSLWVMKVTWVSSLWQVLQSQTTLEDWSTTYWSSLAFLDSIYFSWQSITFVFPGSCLQTRLKYYLLKNCIRAMCNILDLQHTKSILTIVTNISAQCTASLAFLHCNFIFTVIHQQHKVWFPFATCKLNFVSAGLL